MKESKIAKQEKDAKDGNESSLAVLLTQGLMANDNVKIDSVLRETKLDIINSTIRCMQISNVVPLLKAIEYRLRSRSPQEMRSWIQWINCVLAHHMSYLTTQQNLDDELGGLFEWMKGRVGNYQKLLMLQGKLGIIVEQIERRTNTTVRPALQPQIVFNNDDVDSDLDDLESVGSDDSGASSEDDWWDEGEKALGLKDDDDDDDDDDDVDLGSDDDVAPRRGASNANDDDDSSDDDDEDEEEDMEVG